jgi:hypothetical protein
MGAALSYHDAATTVSSARRDTNPVGGKSARKGRKRLRALVRVPDLNWPSNLFSDNIGAADLLAEDFPFQWDMTDGQTNPEAFFQAAA